MGTKREGDFPVDGDEILASDGSRWRYRANDNAGHEQQGASAGSWEQLPEPGPSSAELTQVEEILHDASHGLGEIRDAVQQLGKAHRVWAPTFAKCPIVRSGPPRLDTNVDQAVELVARATLTDKLAYVCDGHPNTGLRGLVLSQLRSVLDQVSMAQVEKTLADMENADLPPGSTPDAVRAARDELVQLASELGDNSKAKATIAVLLNPEAELPDDSKPAEEKATRNITEAPDVLGRQLMLEGVPNELAKRLYVAAVLVANERNGRQQQQQRERQQQRRRATSP